MADIRHAIEIAAAPSTIYTLVSTGPGFEQWWAEDVWEDSGETNLGFFDREAIFRLKLAQQEPPNAARWSVRADGEWNGTRLLFSIESHDGGSRLNFTHADWAAASPYFIECNTTWGELMFRLKDAAEGKPRGPFFTKRGY